MMTATALVALLTACAIEPDKLAEIREDLQKHADSLPQEVLTKPLTVDDAIALSIANNLDNRVKTMEEVLALGKLDLSSFAMLPDIAAKANYSKRGPRKATTSKSLSDGSISDWSTGEERYTRTGDLTATWNLVDFGIAMLRSDQEEDRVKLALEKRRRALHLLVQDVHAAYWKAVINEFAESKYKSLELKLIRSVNDAEEAERSQVGDPMQMLSHQRAIVDTMRQIAEMQRQTATARADLAGLMGLQSATSFDLAPLDEKATLQIDVSLADVEAMQQTALDNRPELKSEEAQFRIDVQDIYAELVKSLPGIGPFMGGHYDANNYLKYNAWADAGVQMAWKLVDVLSLPKRLDQAKGVAEVTRARRLALGMAVVTQVRVADIQYRHALKEYRLTEQMAGIDRRITSLAGKSKEAGSGSAMEEIKAEASGMLSALRRFILYSDLQAAKARLNAAQGIDPQRPQEDKPAPAPESQPQPAEPKPSPAEPQPQATEPKQTPMAEPQAQPLTEPQPQPQPLTEPQPQPLAEPQQPPIAEPQPQPFTEPRPQPLAEPQPPPMAEPQPQPVADPLPPAAEPPPPVARQLPQPVADPLPPMSEPPPPLPLDLKPPSQSSELMRLLEESLRAAEKASN